jgi:hypothetical protein
MRHTSMALTFYRASKKNAHKSTANAWRNLLQKKYVFDNYLQISNLMFLCFKVT